MEEKINLLDFIPSGWFIEKEKSSIWISCYRVFRIPIQSIKKIETISFGSIIALFVPGILNYLDTKHGYIEHITETEWQANLSNVKQKNTLPGLKKRKKRRVTS